MSIDTNIYGERVGGDVEKLLPYSDPAFRTGLRIQGLEISVEDEEIYFILDVVYRLKGSAEKKDHYDCLGTKAQIDITQSRYAQASESLTGMLQAKGWIGEDEGLAVSAEGLKIVDIM